MEKYLRPERFEIEPTCGNATKDWKHWKKTFLNFLSSQDISTSTSNTKGKGRKSTDDLDKVRLQLLINHISSKVFTYISECKTFIEAFEALDKLYIKPRNIIFARHVLATRKQLNGETIDMYMQALMQLSQDCEFIGVDADTNRKDNIRDAFIAGIVSNKIRQRLLENLALSLEEAHNQAVSLEMAKTNCQIFDSSSLNAVSHKVIQRHPDHLDPNQETASVASTADKRKCFFCGGKIHYRKYCPAVESICKSCGKKGHFAKVCKGNKIMNAAALESASERDILAASPACLKKATMVVYIRGFRAEALIDTGSSLSFVNDDFARQYKLKRHICTQTISMASSNHTSQVEGQTFQTIKIGNHTHEDVNLLIVKNLCADLIIGHDVLRMHSSLELTFGGQKEPLKICSVTEASVPAVSIFPVSLLECKPIAIKSRKQSYEDNAFIKQEIKKLLSQGIIEESRSPWRAQVLITRSINSKKRLVIDYSQTVNKYTQLDAYPLPNMEEIISRVSKFSFFSAIDLKSAYHQIPILQEEKKYTAFEADGNLYQFCRIPFGVTNGVSSFQRTIDWLIRKENLAGTFAYLDDITICGKSEDEHKLNLDRFLEAAEKYNLTLNKDKCKFCQESINILGYTISNQIIKPDNERLKPLMELPPPHDISSLRRLLGMFAHYSKWIPCFSDRIASLSQAKQFPLNEAILKSFQQLKSDIAKSCIHAVDDKFPFTVETDASEHSIAATLSQDHRPVAFFSRTLNQSERNHSAVEKEAYAIVESLKKWRHFLIGRPFQLITDQKSVSFMFNNKHPSKIKNEKIQRWRLELAPYKYDITYRPGKHNAVADALSRVCATTEARLSKLSSLHEYLCHPGITRMLHWVRSKNLPYSTEDVRKIISSCRSCAEIKPKFFKDIEIKPKLIKAIAPFERLSIDFKGPIPSNTSNKYLLTVIDEFSRFPFAFPCPNVNAQTVIKNMNIIFTMFGMPAYIHSDRGASFLSADVKEYLSSRGVATSRTTPYNPQGNGQVERLNSTLWKSILLALNTKKLSLENWENVLNEALHSIRSLLCTATNCTPHERMFIHSRRSINGNSLPTWLATSEKVLMRKFNRNNKYQPLIEEVDLLYSNPNYSHVRLQDGRETTISNRHLAPIEDNTEAQISEDVGDDDTDVQHLRRSSRLRARRAQST